MTTTKSAAHTPGPWRWQGEDYRGGWGWQLLVGPEGEGIICGESPDGPYKHLRAEVPIEPQYCKTGFSSDDDSAPAVHVRRADAALIAAAPDLLAALRDVIRAEDMREEMDRTKRNAIRHKWEEFAPPAWDRARAALARAEGRE